MARTLRNNIQALQERGELTKEDISNPDMITLLLESLFYSRPRPGESSTTSPSSYDLLGQSSSSVSELSSDSLATDEDVFMDYTRPVQIQSSFDAAHCPTEAPYSFTNFESMVVSNVFDVPQPPSETPLHSKNFDSDTSSLASKVSLIEDGDTQMAWYETLSEKYQHLESSIWQFGGATGNWPFIGGSDWSSGPSPLQTVTLPLIYPGDPINEIVLSCRDRARDLLRSGVPLQSVMGSGPTDVELLFRMRQPDEEWNLPGWACEVGLPSELMAWGLQDVEWNVKLAEVFMRVRFMRWLILPGAETLTGIPGILRPTTVQMRFPHPVAIDFLPIPAVRTILVRRPRDWQTPLSRSKYSCNWDDNLGPAIVTDPLTGRRILSAKFEKHICTYQNWSVGKSILETWPELWGEMTLDKEK
ncbi:uncharacterized protein A1O9_02282 [Exophiala aquamarina CBS 119918]|uniref:Uncharacterized protein n=1 Tax=Exophiala aquamarina CBS 119918 TaxID=1182545 RepID=A0A072PLI3_9EURO|nr:uncharacterized protein A1O9_02282 [Exophiala aquamarina CBS 119918]KEF60721.1 hypothetical protein A1O9_02282 [Exophiala aquamarina CBS 119918]